MPFEAEPYVPPRPEPLRGWLTMAPFGCVGLAAAAFATGLVLESTQLWAVAVFCFVIGLSAFALVQFYVMSGGGRRR
jgi:hypothetical protein